MSKLKKYDTENGAKCNTNLGSLQNELEIARLHISALQNVNADLKYKKEYLVSGYETILDELKKENSELKTKMDKAVEALKWQKEYIRNYCIFVHPLKNKDGLETDKHVILNIEKTLKEIGVE